MKALTIHQPWASLIEHGYKAIETRGWRTHHRGPVAICSGKAWGDDTADHAFGLIEDWNVKLTYPNEVQYFNAPDLGHVPDHAVLPLGCCLCVADLWGCLPVAQIDNLSPQERAMGNYSPGRFAWLLRDVRRVPRPFFVTGKQGLWELDESWHGKQLGLVA